MELSNTAKWPSWLAAALVAVFLAVNFAESRLQSPTSDEPPHIAAGLSYFVTHQIYRANPQHPPLLKELSALSLMAGGVRWPHNKAADYLVNGDDPARIFGSDWPIGNGIIRDNGPDRVMFWARLPLILIAASLAALLYLWGRQTVGPLAAVGAVFLYVLDPTILAHSHLVTTDVGLAAFTILSMFALWNYMCDPSWKGLAFCGLAVGSADGEVLGRVPVAGDRPVAAGGFALEAQCGRRTRVRFPEAAPRRRAARGSSTGPCCRGVAQAQQDRRGNPAEGSVPLRKRQEVQELSRTAG